MCKQELSRKIEALTIELTKCKSVVGTEGEIDISNKIYSIFSEMEYYKKHPEYLELQDFKDDALERKNVIAILRGKETPENKAVVLIGHTDTVGVSDYTGFEDYATQPEELMEKLKTLSLSSEARDDLNSGNYLFGRGIFDMKCGVATIMSIIEDLSKNPEDFEGTLVFAAVGDEEGSSGGMLSFVPRLSEIKDQYGLDYQAVIDTDYMAPRFDNDDNRYIYIGTVGKLMPSFLIVGKETHVGQPFKGLDPNQIGSEIIRKVNCNMAFSDVAEGEVSLPPITLKQRDLKKEYSVQISTKSNLFFNYATHSSTPDQVLEKMVGVAHEAFSDVVNMLNERYDVFCKSSGFPFGKLPWQPRVMTYDELYNAVKCELGEALDAHIEKTKAFLLENASLCEREFSLRIVEEVHALWSDKNPVVVVYFSPPYYPHNNVNGKNDKESKLLSTVASVVGKLESNYTIVNKNFYPYISDLSFVSAPQCDDTIDSLKNNMPALGSRYRLPINDMKALNLPVVNIGPFGKDAHQYTERIERDYSFNVAPGMVYDTILGILS